MGRGSGNELWLFDSALNGTLSAHVHRWLEEEEGMPLSIILLISIFGCLFAYPCSKLVCTMSKRCADCWKFMVRAWARVHVTRCGVNSPPVACCMHHPSGLAVARRRSPLITDHTTSLPCQGRVLAVVPQEKEGGAYPSNVAAARSASKGKGEEFAREAQRPKGAYVLGRLRSEMRTWSLKNFFGI